MSEKALFGERAGATLKASIEIFEVRGKQYGDTWRDCQWLALRATAKELGITIPEAALRAIGAAAFLDMKYQRLQGGFNADHLVDGINYAGFLAEEVKAIHG